MNHLDEERLNDFVDGLLTDEGAGEVEDHLQACERCRRRARALEELTDGLASLPREVRPGRDLRPRTGEPRREARTAAGSRRWLRAAAVAALVAGGAAAAWLGLHERAGPDRTGDSAVVAPYVRATSELEEELGGRREALSPPAARALRVGLRSVDRAIGDLRSARRRAEGPSGDALTRRLEAVYRAKLELLRSALSTLEET